MSSAAQPAEEPYLQFARPDVGNDEADAVREAILSGWLTTGERCRQLEQAVSRVVGARYAVAVSSCTAAMHLSLEALGVRPGDLVVTTPYTFAATAEVIRYIGAVPVFVDIDPATFNIDPGALEIVLDRLENGDPRVLPPALRGTVQPRRPAAILPVDVGGVPCAMDRIAAIATTHEIAVVEDAAHAFTAERGSRVVGAGLRSDGPSTTCFSFYATKAITTGEGGMLVTDEAHVADRARTMSLHGISRDPWSRDGHTDSWRYEIVAPGFKYNMTDLTAALGLVQLEKAVAMRDRRAAVARAYDDVFGQHDALEIPTVPPATTSSWHLYMLRVRPDECGLSRDELVRALHVRGIGTSVHFMPLHLHAYYRTTYGYEPDDFPVATAEFEREISLPIHSTMSDVEVARVIDAVVELVSESGP
jgi:perosamine synthetase